jgi:hypothetical protein
MRVAFWIISFFNLAAALAYSVKFLFVTPTIATTYYALVSWILSVGFAILARMERK